MSASFALSTASAVPEMRLVLLPGVIALGAVLGSFIGVVADRWPRGEDFVHGRSRCRACGTILTARDMVPLASWLVSRGRCRHCLAPIPIDTLLAELGGGIIALIAAELGGMGSGSWAQSAAWGAFGGGLLLLALIDARHFWLPDLMTLPLTLTGILATYIIAEPALSDRIAGAVAGWAALTALGFAYRRLRGHDGLGGGDAKLLAAIGAWLGWAALPLVVLAAALGGLAWALTARLRGNPAMKHDTALPLGAYLAVAALGAMALRAIPGADMLSTILG